MIAEPLIREALDCPTEAERRAQKAESDRAFWSNALCEADKRGDDRAIGLALRQLNRATTKALRAGG